MKAYLITGASGGIGQAIARQLDQKDNFLWLHYGHNQAQAESLADSLQTQTQLVQADLAQPEQISQMFQQIQAQTDKLDGLVNNAGILQPAYLPEIDLQMIEQLMRVNFAAAVFCCQQAVRLMPAGSSIVNIASMRGMYGYTRPGNLVYSASKAAMLSMTSTLAQELAPDIRVNAVAPMTVKTDLLAGYTAEQIQQREQQMYLKRLVKPEQVAAAVEFLLSESANAITGEIIQVDNGYHLK